MVLYSSLLIIIIASSYWIISFRDVELYRTLIRWVCSSLCASTVLQLQGNWLQIYDFYLYTVIYSSPQVFITNQHNDQLLIGLSAQLVEHCTGISEVMSSNPVQTWIFFKPYFHYCLSSVRHSSLTQTKEDRHPRLSVQTNLTCSSGQMGY